MNPYLPPKPADRYLKHAYLNLLRIVLIITFLVFLTEILSAQPRTLKTNGSFYKKSPVVNIPTEQVVRVHLTYNNGFVEITWVANLKGNASSFFSMVEGNPEAFCVVLDANIGKNKYERVGSIRCRNLTGNSFSKKHSPDNLTSVITYHVYFLSEENKILNSMDIPIQFFNNNSIVEHYSNQ